jgi:Cu2+-exporting ATPase
MPDHEKRPGQELSAAHHPGEHHGEHRGAGGAHDAHALHQGEAHAQHGAVGSGHSGHHAHMVADFRRRFWICLILSVPVLALAPLIQRWLGLNARLLRLERSAAS